MPELKRINARGLTPAPESTSCPLSRTQTKRRRRCRAGECAVVTRGRRTPSTLQRWFSHACSGSFVVRSVRARLPVRSCRLRDFGAFRCLNPHGRPESVASSGCPVTTHASAVSSSSFIHRNRHQHERNQVDGDHGRRRPEVVGGIDVRLDLGRTERAGDRHAHAETALVIHHERREPLRGIGRRPARRCRSPGWPGRSSGRDA